MVQINTKSRSTMKTQSLFSASCPFVLGLLSHGWPALLSVALLGFGLATEAHSAAPAPLPESIRLTSGWQLQDASKVPQQGEAISRADYQPGAWHRAVVPGTVLTSLVQDGVYPEPLYGENNRSGSDPG